MEYRIPNGVGDRTGLLVLYLYFCARVFKARAIGFTCGLGFLVFDHGIYTCVLTIHEGAFLFRTIGVGWFLVQEGGF